VRRRILEAALEVFAESGYRATTMKAVAERAGISQRGLVHHFASKDDLLAGVLADYDAHVAATMSRATGGPALDALLDVITRDMGQPVVIELYSILSAEASSPHHPAHEHYQRRYTQFRRYLVDQFDVLLEQGLLRSKLGSETLARLFMATLDGLQSQWLYDRDDVDVAGTLRALLNEILIDSPAPTAELADT